MQQVADATDLAAFDEMYAFATIVLLWQHSSELLTLIRRVCQSLIKIENIENEGVDEEMFSDLIFEVFTAQLSNCVEERANSSQ